VIRKYEEKIESLEQVVGQGNWTIEKKWKWIKKVIDGALQRKRSRIRRKKIEFKD